MLQAKQFQTLSSSVPNRFTSPSPRAWRCRTVGERSSAAKMAASVAARVQTALFDASLALLQPSDWQGPETPVRTQPEEIDPLYLFACFLAWESTEDPSAAWELIAAAKSRYSDTRAHARALLSSSKRLNGVGYSGDYGEVPSPRKRPPVVEEDEMKAPYGLEIVENCIECPLVVAGDFCSFSQPTIGSFAEVSQKSILPAGAILFVEGQSARGVFILCSGKINLSTNSREGKILLLKTAGPGEALGLSATISGANYEATAETATPCVVNFVERKHFLELMQIHPQVGLHAAEFLSRDYQSAYRDIHELVLTRSSAGKLARLLLSQAPREGVAEGRRKNIPMTHEEMAMRIGSSRETVTRLLCHLRKQQLICLDGPTLVIRDRTALEALAV